MLVKQKGFTLVELVVVIVILGILAATALPKFIDLTSDANAAAVAGVAGGLSSASAINVAGCAVTGNVGGAKCTVMSAAATTCATIGNLLSPPLALVVKPATTVRGTYYVSALTALTTAGTSCTLVLGDGTAAGVVATYTGHATGL